MRTLNPADPYRSLEAMIHGGWMLLDPVRATWKEACLKNPGRWVAMANARVDEEQNPIEGDVVAVNEDLGDLCAELKKIKSRCIIKYCSDRNRHLAH